MNTKILVVDGDRLMREFLKFMFTGKNFVVEEANNCEEALEKIAQNKPDMIVMDSRMGKIKKSSVTQGIPVVLCERPYSFEDLYKKVSKVLDPK